MAQNSPGVIYLEVDEDITSAIDRLTKSSGSSVQMVTAKRSTLFQSVINLKLLKKAAADAGKSLTLVTSDRVATNLAGRIGVPIASQVGEAGAIPKAAPAVAAVDDEIDGGDDDDDDEEDEPTVVPVKTSPPPSSATTDQDIARASQPAPAPQRPTSAPAAAAGAAASPKGKSLVPNIGAMQKRIFWIAGGILAVVLLVALNFYLAQAKVTLFARGTQVKASFQFVADPSVQQSNIDEGVLSATEVAVEKTLSGSVTATGTKDNGTKADGTMTVYNSYDSSPHKLVAGTRFMSADGKIFRSTTDAIVPGGSLGGGKVIAGQTSVPVQADQNGDQYNLGPARYSIPGLSSAEQSGIYGQGSQMQGGTSKTVKVVTQADIDKAKQAALDAEKDKVQEELSKKAGDGQVVLTASLKEDMGKIDANPEAGSEAQNGTVSVQISYSELAVKKSELSDMTTKQEEKQIGADKQVYNDGSDNLKLTPVGQPDASGARRFSASATAFAGGKIDKAALAKELKGKKYSEAVDIAANQPDVERADVSLSPSWATGLPQFTSHIHIDIKVSDQ
jgi:hypothetical protein